MFLRLLLVAALLLSAPHARAQHGLTEAEAAKLTLDSLTATPRPVYRPIYRPLYHPVVAMRRVHRAGYVSRQTHTALPHRHHGRRHFRRN